MILTLSEVEVLKSLRDHIVESAESCEHIASPVAADWLKTGFLRMALVLTKVIKQTNVVED